MKSFHTSKLWLAAVLGVVPALAQAQTQTESAGQATYFSNALFNTLIVIALVLLILIIVLSNVMKSVINSELLDRKLKEEQTSSSSAKNTLLILLPFLFLSGSMLAGGEGVKTVSDDRIGGLDQGTFYFMISVIFLELIIVGVLLYTMRFLLAPAKKAEAPVEVKESVLIGKLTDMVPITEEESILLDHDYDGIRELDNNLPPWWKYGFYVTIIVAVVYLFNYHILGTGDLQAAEYNKEMALAKAEVEEYMKTAANNVDETTVQLSTDAAEIAAGKDLFMANCLACHGKQGEGSVGPNLTDAYWLHGGGVADVFKSIKYGWQDKGMKSWKEDFSPVQIAQLCYFIHSLQGTNPPNAKPAQGELYNETATPTDSTQVKTDTLQAAVADSLQK